MLTTSAALVATDPGAPSASADSLQRFGSCAELRQWYVDHSFGRVTAWGWGYPLVHLRSGLPNAASATAAEQASTPDAAVASSPTGTNVQEAGVDEPDVAKTDGHLVVRTSNGRLVVTDVSGSAPRELSSYALPAGTGNELLLVHGHAILSGSSTLMRPLTIQPQPLPRSMPAEPGPGHTSPGPIAPITPGPIHSPLPSPPPVPIHPPMPLDAGTTRIVDVDLTDPAHPRLASDRTFTGRLVSMREYGDTVRIVTDTGLPDLDFTAPRDGSARAHHRALAHNREVVRHSSIADWLPSVRDGGSRHPVVDCADVFHPRRYAGTDTLTVTGWDVASPSTLSSTAITTGGDLVYSSTDRLYVTTPEYRRPIAHPLRGGPALGLMRPVQQSTAVHEFRLAGIDTTYAASGTVAGTVRDRWSFDEHDGDLRVAVTRVHDGRPDNGITVLRDQAGRLVRVGSVDGLGRNEQLQSVRWFDDLAVLVTFRQLDPLFTVDLRDPEHPRELGELKIPGFSGYLHPLGDHLLLGLGVDATRRGRSLGAQAAVFDISDPARPVPVDRTTFGPGTELPAVTDPHAFTWLPGARTAITAVTRWDAPMPRVEPVSLQVSSDGQLSIEEHRSDLGSATFRALPLPGGRAALVGEHVRVVGVVR